MERNVSIPHIFLYRTFGEALNKYLAILWCRVWLLCCFALVQWLFCFQHVYILGYAEHINYTNQKRFSPKWCGCRDLVNEVSIRLEWGSTAHLYENIPKPTPSASLISATVGYLRSWKYFSRICRRRSTGLGCIWFWASIKLLTVARIYRARVVCHTVYISLKSLASVVSNHIACFSVFSGNNL